jgi:hypothetical protein
MHKPSRSPLIGLLLAAILGALPEEASARTSIQRLCLEDLLDGRRLEQIRVPLGCQLTDCCADCPASGPLTWRVKVTGEAVTSAAVTFSGLPAGQRFQVDGDGRATERGAVAERGETFIRDLHTPPDGSVAYASLELQGDPPSIDALRGGRGAHAEVLIDQLLGDVVVNEFRLKALFRSCERPQAMLQSCDEVNLLSNRGNDSSVVLLDGRRGGECQDDQLLRASASAQVGDVQAAASGCNSEIEVFSAGNAMAMHAPENTWKDGCGDTVDVHLKPPLQVPVSVWLVRRKAAPEAAAAIVHAREVYDRNKTGIAFTTRVVDISNRIQANRATTGGCTGVDSLRRSAFYEPKHINVYYVDKPWPVSAFYTGQNCKDERGVIFIGPAANVATLAHEFGHAFSLFGGKKERGHTEDVDGFDDDNVMAGGGPPTRRHLSLGQAYRFNVDPRSWLNVNGLRPGPTHPCPAKQPAEPDPRCPRLQLDWERP